VKLEVLVDSPGQVADTGVRGEREDVIADPLDEVAVVADHDQRAGPAVEEVLERGEGVDVEVVGRLVEQHNIGFRHQQAHELEAASLAAREVADQRARAVAAEAEAIAQHPGRKLLAIAEGDLSAYGLQRFEHA